MSRWEFDGFSLSERELKRGNDRVALERRPLRVLVYLVVERPRVVSKNELVTAAWEGAFVSNDAVDKAVSRIRTALGDDATHPRFVETVHAQGYKFVAPVVERDRVVPRVSAYTPGDRAHFVQDMNLPDGTTVTVGERFTKRWKILNTGSVPWVDRYLQRQGPANAAGRLQSEERVQIPDTPPGQVCLLTVELCAPNTPGSCYAEWKMVDAQGRFCLPHQTPVYVSVDVKERGST